MDTHSQSKSYDIFISHSSCDKPIAEQLAKELEAQGYQVWLDTWEILVGHNIVDEVYKGITNSKFMVVLLSNAACESKWVKEEFTSARMTEIENRQVVILPAKIEDCEVPAPLKGKKYADFTKGWNSGFKELIAAVNQHPTRQPNNLPAQTAASIPSPPNFSELDQWRKGLLPEIAAADLAQGQPFKDVLIGPVNGDVVNIEKTRLKSIVDTSRVRLQGWGGPLFPYDKYPSTREVRLPDGLRYVDTKPWPNRSRSFHFWQIDAQLRFLQRNDIDEDCCVNQSGESYMVGRLVRAWALLDIIRPLLFTRNLLIHETGLMNLGVKFIWGGLRGRSLLELNTSWIGFSRDYRCEVDSWYFGADISRNSDLAAVARKAVLDLSWLFGWEPDSATLNRDLNSLVKGIMPD